MAVSTIFFSHKHSIRITEYVIYNFKAYPMPKQVGRGIFGSGVVMTFYAITTPKRGTVGFPYVPRRGVVMDAPFFKYKLKV